MMKPINLSQLTPTPQLAPEEIQAIREDLPMSQRAFARYLFVSPQLVARWESGASSPQRAALKLLHLVKRKGIECLT